MKRVRKGDTVIVTTGRSRNHVGKILRVLKDGRVVVEGANLIKKHVKPNPQIDQKGGIVTREASIHASNVALYDPIAKKASRVGYKFIEKDGKKHKVRYLKSNNELVDLV